MVSQGAYLPTQWACHQVVTSQSSGRLYPDQFYVPNEESRSVLLGLGADCTRVNRNGVRWGVPKADIERGGIAINHGEIVTNKVTNLTNKTSDQPSSKRA